MTDYLVIQPAKGSSNGQFSFKAGKIISDDDFDIAALRSAGVALIEYDQSTMESIVGSFLASLNSSGFNSLLPLLLSNNVIVPSSIETRLAALETKALQITDDGGFAVPMVNDTGSPTVKGSLVEPSSSIDNGFVLTNADAFDPIGVVLESGIADGQSALVVTTGKAYALLEDSSSATKGYWVRTSITQAGRIDATNALPPGGGVVQLDAHTQECGHCLESVLAGTDQLCLISLHFL